MPLTEYKVFHDAEWKQFLDGLNQHDRDIAGMTMDWIKNKYGRIINEHWAIINKIQKLQEDLVEIWPLISRANAMSTEMDKKVKFEIVLISPQARGDKAGRTQVYSPAKT